MKNSERQLFNIVLIHVARSWERVRLEQDFEEMPQDNLESLESIQDIATEIMDDKHIVMFLKSKENDYFITHTNEMSDTYIENLATKIIKQHYI
jgi:hypothetical protein